MVDKSALFEELRKGFIDYQYRLEYPFPSQTDSGALPVAKYQTDVYFRNRVDSLACGVMQIIDKFV